MPLRRRTLCPHNAWTYSRGIAPLTHHQHPRRSQPLAYIPPWRADDSSTLPCQPHHGGRPTFRLETVQARALWCNYWSGQNTFLTQANLYTNDDTIFCCVFPTSFKGGINMVRRTPSMVHRQLWHLCQTFQLLICNQLVILHDFHCFG